MIFQFGGRKLSISVPRDLSGRKRILIISMSLAYTHTGVAASLTLVHHRIRLSDPLFCPPEHLIFLCRWGQRGSFKRRSLRHSRRLMASDDHPLHGPRRHLQDARGVQELPGVDEQ